MTVQETRIVSKFLRERPDDSWTYEAARAYNGAYTRLEKAFAMTPDERVAEVQASGLRGRGGACSPGTSVSTATRASPARSRTTCWSSAIRTRSSRA